MQIHVHVHLAPAAAGAADAQAIGDGKILQGLAALLALLAQFGLIKPVAVPGVSSTP